MFCTFCGSPVAAEQSVCPHCGHTATGALAASAARTRVAAHVHLLAILWLVLGSFWLLPAVVLALVSAFVAIPLAADGADQFTIALAPAVLRIISLGLLAFAALHFVAGWGLLKLRPWGRKFALAMSFLGLIHPPFDTALGVYTLFVLLPDAASDEYRRMCQTPLPDTTASAGVPAA